MTTKQTTKQTTTKVLTVTAHGERARELAKLHIQGISLTEAMDKIVKAEHAANEKAGRECGTVKSGDEFMVTLQSELIESGRYKTGSKTLANLMSRVRQAVNNGTAFQHASSEKAAKEAAAKKTRGARQSVGEKSVVKLTIVKDAQAFDVAQGLREAINDTKFRESYGELAAFLTDALNEFQGA
jgi:hypothetical protein